MSKMAAGLSRFLRISTKLGRNALLQRQCSINIQTHIVPSFLAKQKVTMDSVSGRGQLFAYESPLFALNESLNQRRLTHKEISDPIWKGIYSHGDPETNQVKDFPLQNQIMLPSIFNTIEKVIIEDNGKNEELLMGSLIKIRRKKMNKHKYKKRIHRDIAKIRKIRHFRLKKKRGRQHHKKTMLVKKLSQVLAKNPKSDLITRPYVVYRLKNW